MARIGIYPAYRFKDHDPVLDAVDTVIADSKKTRTQVHEMSNVSVSTLSSWAKRKTKRPQFATVAAVVKSLGAELHIKYKGKNII